MSNQTAFPAGTFKSVPYVLMQSHGLNANTVMVYAVMMDGYNFYTSKKKVYSPSDDGLAKILNVDPKTVTKSIKILVDLGLVRIDFKKRGLATHYSVFAFDMNFVNEGLADQGIVEEEFEVPTIKVVSSSKKVETQQEMPVEAPETLPNEVNTPKMDECVPDVVKALTDAPTKPERILGLPDEESVMTSPSPTTPSEAKFANVPDKFKPARRIDFSIKEEEQAYGIF